MISVEQAVAAITSAFRPLPAEQVPLPAALGRVLTQDLTARVTQPPAAVSAMDGYAVRAADAAEVPATLKVIGESAAGARFAGALDLGQAVRIFTGAAIPSGADAIVIQEDTRVEGDTVTILTPAATGKWIRPAGLDFSAGDVLLTAGRQLTARDIGLAAAMNIPWLQVRRRPRVAYLTTGDEVVMPGQQATLDQIYSSNSLLLGAGLAAMGAEPLDLGVVVDNEAALREAIGAAQGADLLVTTGGAAVGDHDLVARVMAGTDVALNFYKVASRPGKPLIFGRIGETPLLGLPGNPVSVGVGLVVYVQPAIQALLGLPAVEPSTALLGRDLPANDTRQEFMRATLSRDRDGNWVATPFDRQDSAMLAALARADALVIRPAEAPVARRGDPVRILPFPTGPFPY